MLPLGELVAPPCQALWARRPSLASDSLSLRADQDRGSVNDKWDEDRWVRKGGKIGEVACGSLIESRSGLSWWGGGDDRGRRRAGVGGGLQGLWQPHTPRRMTASLSLLSPLNSPPHTHTHTHTPPSVFLISPLLPLFFLSPVIPHCEGARHAYRSSRGCVKISQSFISNDCALKIDCIHY